MLFTFTFTFTAADAFDIECQHCLLSFGALSHRHRRRAALYSSNFRLPTRLPAYCVHHSGIVKAKHDAAIDDRDGRKGR